MKKLSDYKGDEAIELWADLLEPLNNILADDVVRKSLNSGESRLMIAKAVLKSHKKDAEAVLLRIDPTPLDGMNIIMRLIAVLADIGQSDEIKSFFGYAEQAKEVNESGGSVTANTKVVEK